MNRSRARSEAETAYRILQWTKRHHDSAIYMHVHGRLEGIAAALGISYARFDDVDELYKSIIEHLDRVEMEGNTPV